ncbi:cysteine desulfurase family protein [Aquiflexum gelatinilyticum]|uniref:cysteine desulfurase family protein n=1 Tax=Aquiflexum gelatinilyticum TaxID=2961943 RepID=UPI00216A542B|nr:cysteine desulfurase family protein [Aquiflexum gelatinilyticum]MCS4436906.1 cysteine desulfurase [Aquiflexum gelatinilyticum]
MKYPIYLDYNATTPCAPEVIEAMLPWFGQHFGNAASKSHPYGWMAEDAVETAREQVANLIGAKPKEIIFTSGATEAINLALKGIFEHYIGEKQHYISCQTEHKAVLDTLDHLQSKGAEVTYLPVNQFGEINLEQLNSSILPHTKMIALMWANNETGLIHQMDRIKEIAEKGNIILFTDAVQAAGKIPLDIKGIHLMAISAHKMYGPKGVGALYVRHNHPLPKPLALMDGGGHEKGFRSGTLNVPGIVGFGMAAALRSKNLIVGASRLESLRNLLESRILEIDGTTVNGNLQNRLSHVSNISFRGVEGVELLQRVNKEVAVSSGSACTSISPKPSHVLAAMGIEPDLGRASIRFSLGLNTTESEIIFAAEYIKKVVETLRKS